jgi:hypothetical protein
MTTLAPVLKHQFLDNNGNPLSGGKLFSYLAGTSELLATFADSSGLIRNPNPVILNSRGECDLWLDDASTYDFVLRSSTDVLIWTQNNVQAPGSGGGGSGLPNQAGQSGKFLSTDGTNPIWVVAPAGGTGGMPTVRQAPFNAQGDGTTPDQAAFTAASAAFPQLRIPPGNYRFSANTTINAAMAFDAGAVLVPDTGVTITIVGVVEAGRSLHFGGLGTTVFAPGSVDFVSAEWFGLSTTGTEANNNAALVKAWTASFGTGLRVGRGAFPLNDTTLPAIAVAGTSQLPNFFLGAGVDGNGGGGGVSTNVGTSFFGPAARIHFQNSTATNSDAKILIGGFHIVGPNDNVVGVGGLKMTKLSGAIVQAMQTTGSRGHGAEFIDCYGVVVRDNTFLSNRWHGILCNQRFNQSHLLANKCIGNGKDYAGIYANIAFAGGAGLESLAPVIELNDTSYSGLFATLYKRNNPSPSPTSITLTNVVVSGGVATATTSTAHGRTTNDYISVYGCTSAPALNTVFSPQITVTSTTAFTWLTTAPNGTYVDSTIVIGPAAYGAIYNAMRGAKISHYAEDCIGVSSYMGANAMACDFVGGYNQGFNVPGGGNGIILFDNPTNIDIGSISLSGVNSLLKISATDRKHGINVRSTVMLENSAQIQYANIVMRDGKYYAASFPTSGIWAVADMVYNLFPTPGAPQSWYCSTAPLTFVAMDAAGGGGGGSLPSQSGNAGRFLTTDGTNPSWADPPTGASFPPQGGQAGKFLTTNGTVVSWALPTTLSALSANMGTLTQGNINTIASSGSVAAASGTFTGLSVTANASVGGVFSGATAAFSGRVDINVGSGIGLNVNAPPAGNAIRAATSGGGGGAALTLDASSGGTALYAIGPIRIDLAPASGTATASTAVLAAKPGGSTNGQWIPVNLNGVAGHMLWWPVS